MEHAGASTQTRGVFLWWINGHPDTYQIPQIDFIKIAITGNAQDFGDLSFGRSKFGGG